MAHIAGVFPVVSTPFAADGGLLLDDLDRLTRYCAAAGAHGVVYPAIASEFATLTAAERQSATERVLAVSSEVGLQAIIGISASEPEQSRALAELARDNGAAATMLMVPRIVGQSAHKVATFIERATRDLGNIEIVLQNAPPPLGSSLPTDVLAAALRETPWVGYIKEEITPCGQRMTRLIASLGSQLKGILGGAGGRFVLDEYARGACGTMPSCELVELHRLIWDHVQGGRLESARSVFKTILPILDMAAVFRQSVVKEVLLRRNLITSGTIRDDNPALDAQDRKEIELLLAAVLPLLPDSGA